MLQLLQNIAQSYTTYTYETSTTNVDPETALTAVFSFLMITMVFMLPFIIFNTVIMWKTFAKAGKPGWAVLVPIYNAIVAIQIAGKPIWWILLLFIPIVNIVISAILSIETAKRFGQDAAFGFLLFFLPIIGYAILAFGSAKYMGEGDDMPQMAAAPMGPQAMPPQAPIQPPVQPTVMPPAAEQQGPVGQPPQQPPTNLVQ